MRPLNLFIFGLLGMLSASCNWRLHTRSEPKAETAEAPNFVLPDADGNIVSLDSLLAKGPAVLVFYRGYW